jgi:hypothetical protein
MLDILLWGLGLAVTVWLGLPPLLNMREEQRSHIRSVWARVEPVIDDGVWIGGRLTVVNGSRWPVWNVIVMDPASLHAEDFTSVGPGETRIRQISVERMDGIYDEAVTIQIRDSGGRLWFWTPETSTLSPIPRPVTLLQRLVQRVHAGLPGRAQDWFSRLPPRLIVYLWGYNPEGEQEGEGYLESHLRRAAQPG